MDFFLFIGILAATLTTLAFLPQVIKAHQSKHTKDLSLWMCLLLASGIALWVVYGIYLNSIPVIGANSITLVLILYLIILKVRHG